ncbi:Haloacid dehalogenase- type II [Apiospora marii]|uniref:Haloacid dehalogenase- type II n=1 Tax=Apiospora marii TaxID=335849 RepID=A0ABR1R0U0_9PEZI
MATDLKLSNYRLLCFDVYGTLVDWETGILTALKPLLEANDASAKFSNEHLLTVFHELEASQQRLSPSLKYSTLLATVHDQVAFRLGLPHRPTFAESKVFGESVGFWPAFPDTVDALRRLQKHYKLVVLSNVDRESFAATNAGPLQGVPFDLIVTAQDVGTYKPDLGNFEHMLRRVDEEFGVKPEQVIQTAQSQFHDHHPAKKVGLKSSWIVRPGAIMGNRGEELFDWKFDTLGQMADALESGQ